MQWRVLSVVFTERSEMEFGMSCMTTSPRFCLSGRAGLIKQIQLDYRGVQKAKAVHLIPAAHNLKILISYRGGFSALNGFLDTPAAWTSLVSAPVLAL